MPDNWQPVEHHHVVSTSSNVSTDNLEEAMWYLKIQDQDNEDRVDGRYSGPYPDRPGEPDCIYYLRTGCCGYGSNCRFNHPPNHRQAVQYRGEPPERVGQPDCQFFLKTGTCKFGATCKYHHPRDKHEAGKVLLNLCGLPMRQGEKACPYYMRTGSCKFGVACKFNHPQLSPAGFGSMYPLTGPSVYGSTGSSVIPSTGPPFIGGLPTWTFPRAPYLSGSRMQAHSAYMPVVLSSQSMLSAPQSWSTYSSNLSPLSPNSGSNLVQNSKKTPDLASVLAQHFPERPDQPECQYFIKTGSCKFGLTCKYHHPKERILAPLSAGILSPLGLPLKPGHAVCTHYSMYGICKFGSACKFDHPLAGYYHSVPTQSMIEPRNPPSSHPLAETSPPKVSELPDEDLPKRPEPTSSRQHSSETKESDDKKPETTSHNAPTSSEFQHELSD